MSRKNRKKKINKSRNSIKNIAINDKEFKSPEQSLDELSSIFKKLLKM